MPPFCNTAPALVSCAVGMTLAQLGGIDSEPSAAASPMLPSAPLPTAPTSVAAPAASAAAAPTSAAAAVDSPCKVWAIPSTLDSPYSGVMLVISQVGAMVIQSLEEIPLIRLKRQRQSRSALPRAPAVLAVGVASPCSAEGSEDIRLASENGPGGAG